MTSETTMTLDPTVTNPDNYKVVFENDRVRVLEFTDQPGVRTTPHEHPDSVLVVLSTFQRRMYAMDGESHDVQLTAGKVGWLDAQQHAGHNIGDTDSHVILVELKDAAHAPGDTLGRTGPAVG